MKILVHALLFLLVANQALCLPKNPKLGDMYQSIGADHQECTNASLSNIKKSFSDNLAQIEFSIKGDTPAVVFLIAKKKTDKDFQLMEYAVGDIGTPLKPGKKCLIVWDPRQDFTDLDETTPLAFKLEAYCSKPSANSLPVQEISPEPPKNNLTREEYRKFIQAREAKVTSLSKEAEELSKELGYIWRNQTALYAQDKAVLTPLSHFDLNLNDTYMDFETLNSTFKNYCYDKAADAQKTDACMKWKLKIDRTKEILDKSNTLRDELASHRQRIQELQAELKALAR